MELPMRSSDSFERYIIRDQIHSSVFGFQKGKGTQKWWAQYHNGSNAQSSYFIDFKGAFDIAFPTAILHELTLLGVKGKLLLWIKDYLSLRRAKLELGTPQGVLSPSIFNIIMDFLCKLNNELGGLCSNTFYVDDILIQVFNRGEYVLQRFSKKCTSLRLIINPTKTKYNFRSHKLSYIPRSGGQVIAKTGVYKYLDPHPMSRNSRFSREIVLNIRECCLERLGPLRYISNRYIGASLRNKAMRVILGCPMTAEVHSMRKELDLPAIHTTYLPILMEQQLLVY
ncbi:uncharacterized protein [Penaeus vannamei]|uniref:uncharacterized protein n=1 Tax=Penaeus vannamei TaxID=6689 RepID=UPI00387F3A39